MFRTLKSKLTASLALVLLLAVMMSGMCFASFADDTQDIPDDSTTETNPDNGTGSDETTPDEGTGEGETDGGTEETPDSTPEGGETEGDGSEETTPDAGESDTDKDDSSSTDKDDDKTEDDDDHDHDEEEEEKEEKTGFAKFWDSYNQLIGYILAGILFVAMVLFIIWWIPKDKKSKKK